MEIPSRKEIRVKNLFNVSEVILCVIYNNNHSPTQCYCTQCTKSDQAIMKDQKLWA